MGTKIKLNELNIITKGKFIQIFDNVVEEWPQAARFAVERLPFDTTQSLVNTFHEHLDTLPESDKLKILQLHPDLAGKLADEGKLTAESTAEQASAGLNAMNTQQKAELNRLNEEYKEKYGFPFVICVRQANKVEGILAGLRQRINNTKNVELDIGIEEVKKICQLRIGDIVEL